VARCRCHPAGDQVQIGFVDLPGLTEVFDDLQLRGTDEVCELRWIGGDAQIGMTDLPDISSAFSDLTFLDP
jgi:hypothetical protein